MLNGQFAGAVTWASMVGDYNTGYTTGAFNRLIRMDHPDLMKQIRIIWQSPLIPNGPILVSNALPADFKAKVVAAVKKAGHRGSRLLYQSDGRYSAHRPGQRG